MARDAWLLTLLGAAGCAAAILSAVVAGGCAPAVALEPVEVRRDVVEPR